MGRRPTPNRRKSTRRPVRFCQPVRLRLESDNDDAIDANNRFHVTLLQGHSFLRNYPLSTQRDDTKTEQHRGRIQVTSGCGLCRSSVVLLPMTVTVTDVLSTTGEGQSTTDVTEAIAAKW